MTEQFNLFEMEAENRRLESDLEQFQKWLSLEEKTFIDRFGEERKKLCSILAAGYGKLYIGAHHVCQQMPNDKYIWLNHIEPAEFWVLNDKGNPCGENVDECPFCGADLKHGQGDAVLIKASSLYWEIKGFVK